MRSPSPMPPPAMPPHEEKDAIPVIDSAALLKGGAEVLIRHGGREYRLRRTRFDKLILTA